MNKMKIVKMVLNVVADIVEEILKESECTGKSKE